LVEASYFTPSPVGHSLIVLTPPPVGVLPFIKGESYAQTVFIVQAQCLYNTVPFFKGDERSGGVNTIRERKGEGGNKKKDGARPVSIQARTAKKLRKHFANKKILHIFAKSKYH
jgi:hypothetical protein